MLLIRNAGDDLARRLAAAAEREHSKLSRYVLPTAVALTVVLGNAVATEINQSGSAAVSDPALSSRNRSSASAKLPELSVTARKKETAWDPRICIGCGDSQKIRVPTSR